MIYVMYYLMVKWFGLLFLVKSAKSDIITFILKDINNDNNNM